MSKMKLRAGLDLDGTVYDFVSPFDLFMEVNGYGKKDKTQYRLTRRYNIKEKKFNKLLEKYSLYRPFLHDDSYPGAIETIKKLNNIMDYYVITDRDWYANAKIDTLKRLISDEIKFKDLIFSPDKAKISEKLNLDLFFEDNPRQAYNLQENGNLVYLLDREYNQDIKGDYIKRINWSYFK